MKLLLTILLGLLLLQSVTALHLHTEEDGSGNVTGTAESSNVSDTVDANATGTVDSNVTDFDKTEEDEQIQRTLKAIDEIEASGDEELISAVREARIVFQAASNEANKKVEAASTLSFDATDQERQEALEKIQKASGEFKEALNIFAAKIQELKSKLEEKQANAGSGSS